MKYHNIDLLKCSEDRWSKSGKNIINEYNICYSDGTTGNRNGVAVIDKPDGLRAVKEFIHVSVITVLLKLNSRKT